MLCCVVLCCVVLCCVVLWCGVVWCGMLWYFVVCCGVMLCDVGVGRGGVVWIILCWSGMGCVCVIFNMLHHLT